MSINDTPLTPYLGREDTVGIRKSILQCSSDYDFYRLVIDDDRNHDSQKNYEWQRYFTNLIKSCQLNTSGVADLCMVSERTVFNWQIRTPSKRENFVAIGIVFGLQIDEINHIMMRYGEFSFLCESKKDDLIFLYMIDLARKDKDITVFKRYYQLAEYVNGMILDILAHRPIAPEEKTKDPYLLIMRNINSLRAVNETIKGYFSLWLKNIGVRSFNSFVKEHNLRPIYSRNYSRISCELPGRDFFISLSLHIGMPLSCIDQTLTLIGMEGLCPKDEIERAVIYILNHLYSQTPIFSHEAVMMSERNIYYQKQLETGSLATYVSKRLHDEYIFSTIAGSSEEKEDKISKFIYL